MSFLVKYILNPFADTVYYTAIISKKKKNPQSLYNHRPWGETPIMLSQTDSILLFFFSLTCLAAIITLR